MCKEGLYNFGGIIEERMSDKELFPLIEKSFLDPDFALTGGESNVDWQKRAIKVLKELLNTCRGQKVVVGTHGAVMTLMMGIMTVSMI